MAYWLSNGHMTDDFTWPWPWKVKLLTTICLSRKWLEIETPFQGTTNRKWHMEYGHVTDDVTCPQRYFEAVRSAILATAWLLVSLCFAAQRYLHLTGISTTNKWCHYCYHIWVKWPDIFQNTARSKQKLSCLLEQTVTSYDNVDSKAEYSALTSTRSQKKKLKLTTPVPL